MKEMRLAQLRKTLLTVDEAVDVVESILGGMRTEGLTFMDDIARENDLSADGLPPWVG